MAEDLLRTLVLVSEKAANIARICRQDSHLLSLLIQEKKEGEKNPRFGQDFKTFADVLVQEVVKRELVNKFPYFDGHVHGEESNEFTCGNETVVVEVKENESDTKDLFLKVLDDEAASTVLAREVHRNIEENVIFKLSIESEVVLPESLSVWIDPIDSTAEYIHGEDLPEGPKAYSGLPCVTVLIGVFDRDTGKPVIGVVNQPFHTKILNQWVGQYVYGINLQDCKLCGPNPFLQPQEKCIAVSSSEDETIKTALTDNGYRVLEIAGAGYKLLCVIMGLVSGYVLSKPTTFMWDTCACHAILESLGGTVLDYKTRQPLEYKEGSGVKNCCNSGGILASRNLEIQQDLMSILDTSSKESEK